MLFFPKLFQNLHCPMNYASMKFRKSAINLKNLIEKNYENCLLEKKSFRILNINITFGRHRSSIMFSYYRFFFTIFFVYFTQIIYNCLHIMFVRGTERNNYSVKITTWLNQYFLNINDNRFVSFSMPRFILVHIGSYWSLWLSMFVTILIYYMRIKRRIFRKIFYSLKI